MNVALTRARFCLIVLGHADTLNSNPVWGNYVDFMVIISLPPFLSYFLISQAQNKRYGKLKNREDLKNIGELVIKGKLVEGNSSVYVKKDWGEEYHRMLLKNNQVNELKLTDFEMKTNTIQIHDVEEQQEIIISHQKTVTNEDSLPHIVNMSKTCWQVEIIAEPENFN